MSECFSGSSSEGSSWIKGLKQVVVSTVQMPFLSDIQQLTVENHMPALSPPDPPTPDECNLSDANSHHSKDNHGCVYREHHLTSLSARSSSFKHASTADSATAASDASTNVSAV